MEGMFTDVTISADLMQAYTTTSQFDLQVIVLTTTHWPTIPQNSFSFPPTLAKLIDSFSAFYYSKHTGRKLTFLNHLGSADLHCHFERKHEANVSIIAMVLLLAFNTNPSMTLDDIKTHMDIPEAELKRTLASLTLGKYKVLVNEDDVYKINASFKSPTFKFRISPISAPVVDSLPAQITLQRKHQIEACLIRTMKARKTMRHEDLVGDVMGQLESLFRPEAGVIKERIEGLIEREYIERQEGQRNVYRYLA